MTIALFAHKDKESKCYIVHVHVIHVEEFFFFFLTGPGVLLLKF